MEIFLAGNWVDKPKKLEVQNPFDNSVIDTVPKADAADLEKALDVRGARRQSNGEALQLRALEDFTQSGGSDGRSQ